MSEDSSPVFMLIDVTEYPVIVIYFKYLECTMSASVRIDLLCQFMCKQRLN